MRIVGVIVWMMAYFWWKLHKNTELDKDDEG